MNEFLTSNKNRVPKKQWLKWSEHARTIFNRVYEFMMENQEIMNHPNAVAALSYTEWKTVCWNSAWIAADACDDIVPTEIVTV